MPERRISHYRVVRKLGSGGMGEVLLAELDGWKSRGYAACADAAQVHVGLREFNAALDQYEEALTRDEVPQGLVVNPTLDELRSFPRFQALLKPMGLPSP